MAELIVPRYDPDEPWPTLGPQVCALIEERMVFGPGSLLGQPAKLDDDKRAWIYGMYEVYPQGHPLAGRRRHKRGGVSVRKGLAKTEFGAWVTLAELHPEGPVRCDRFDAYGQPVGRPVAYPYIPLLAVTVEQVEELMYGALKAIVEEGPDSHLFDVSLERIQRLGPNGREDGRAVPMSNSPGSRDGARTTFQAFDEPHRLFLPRQRAAHETMLGNMSKRAMEDPWSLYVGTAGEPGEGSIAEDLDVEAQKIEAGRKKQKDAKLFYFRRWADGDHDLATEEGRIAAVIEATGDLGEWGPGQFEDIASNWTREGADQQYLERVWLNRWVRSNEQAFSKIRRAELMTTTDPFTKGAFVVAGFDGARFRDSTGIVLTDVLTGVQKMHALWERRDYNVDPSTGELEAWEIDETEVTAAVEEMMRFYNVWRFNCDPPHWTETVAAWAGRWPDVVEEWWTARPKPMALAVRGYKEAMDNGAVTFLQDDRPWVVGSDGRPETYEEAFARHMAAAGRNNLNLFDEDGRQLYVLRKLHLTRKFDAQMAAILSWEGRIEALTKGAQAPKRRGRVKRI